MSFTKPAVVIERIERLVAELLISLESGDSLPVINQLSIDSPDSSDSDDEMMSEVDSVGGENTKQGYSKSLTKQSSRQFSSIFLILNYVHSLLSTKRTTTIREVSQSIFSFIFMVHNSSHCSKTK